MKVLLVDGSALAYRAFFAFARDPLRSSRGEPTTVPFAFLTTLLRWFRRYAPERAGVVFDARGETHRHRLDPNYKANRPARPEGLVEQMPRLLEALRALRVPVLEVPGWEADDVLATLARAFESRGDQVLLASSDKDFRQLLSPAVRLVRPKLGQGDDDEIGPEELRQSLGLGPESIVDLMALVGDPVDNVPGIAGVGEKTAAALLHEHATLDQLFANLDAVTRPALRRKLEEGRERALAARELVRLRVDAPVDAVAAVPEWVGPDWPSLRALLRELELVQLLRSLPAPAESPPDAPTFRIIEDAAALVEFAALVAGAPSVTLHVVQDAAGTSPAALGLAAGESVVAGLRLAPAASPPRPGELAFEVPAGRGLTWPEVQATLGKIFADPERTLVGADLKAATRALEAAGMPVRNVLFDVGVASYVLQPEKRRHDLESLRLEHLDEPARAATTQPEQAAAENAAATERVQAALAPRLATVPRLADLFTNVEMPLLVVLRDMESAGVRVDTAVLGELSHEIEVRSAALTATIQELAGRPFNLHSTQQLGQVLFVELGLPHGRRTRLGWSTDADVLEALAPEHEIARALLEHRTITKLRSTYCEALPRLVDPQSGRIHTTFHQTVASTGRLSSSDPNLQNIPIRSDLGRRIRAAFVARDARSQLVSADYSQIELRLLAHLSGDAALRAALTTGDDVHTATAARIAGCAPEAVTPAQRAAAKAVNFGVVYGMGARGLADRLGIPIDEARRFIDEYFASYPEVHRLTRELVDRARASGEATTILGRRLALPDLESTNPGRRAAAERIAVNAPIQGSAADLVKLAMVRVHRAIAAAGLGARLVLQVHDELVFDAPEAEVSEVRDVVRTAMCGALELTVPLVVEIGTGRNWAEAH